MQDTNTPFGEDFKLLIQERIKNFWGYGNLDSPYWFIGMEEGYNEDNEILLDRFTATAHQQICDIYDDLKVDPGHVYWFEDGAPIQRTWRRLIEMMLYSETGKHPNKEAIRRFQIEQLGRKKSNHALLELMPLPSKSIAEKHWLYADTGIEGLSSRKEYLETYKDERIEALRILIDKHKPKYIICYSLSYQEDWQKLTDAPFIEVNPRRLYLAKDGKTTIAITPHSVMQGLSNDDWRLIIEEMFL
ncbi:hypothetical protein N8083_00670 [Candidatus Pacebacteria bacterium]|nr:hypothetical protein [Candidatus Paceibacterota bacterium]